MRPQDESRAIISATMGLIPSQPFRDACASSWRMHGLQSSVSGGLALWPCTVVVMTAVAKKTAAAAEDDNRTMMMDVLFVVVVFVLFVRAVLVSPNKSILGQVENYKVEKYMRGLTLFCVYVLLGWIWCFTLKLTINDSNTRTYMHMNHPSRSQDLVQSFRGPQIFFRVKNKRLIHSLLRLKSKMWRQNLTARTTDFSVQI